ncbi:transposase [Marinimicrococcus flavescens]|uniref:Transposase n=1 Tax=Marinimicrococcus flavescens TaxID=3031815 RepID=A0AAP3XT37_9PROT|nr:transposase [Marinimicrococcus flavescens]
MYGGDETGVGNVDQTGRSRAPRGQTPVVTRQARRLGGSMIPGVSYRGLMRLMLHDRAPSAGLFPTFLRRLVQGTTGTVVLIVDNLRVHHARTVEAWLAAHQHEIGPFHLPADAPGHTPDERLGNAPSSSCGKSRSPAARTS